MIRKHQAAITGLLLATCLMGDLSAANARESMEVAIAVKQTTSPSTPSSTTTNRLNGTSWRLAFWEGPDALNSLVDDTEITADFVGSNITGSSSCNRYSSPYQVNGAGLTISQTTTTTNTRCTRRVRRQESRYLTAIQGAQSYQINSRGELEIIYRTRRGQGRLTFRQAPRQLSLEGTNWTLTTWTGTGAPSRLISTSPMTAEFTRDAVSGSASCNRYRSTYRISSGNLTIDTVAATRIACAEDIMRQETAFITAVEGVQTYEISSSGQLQISYRTSQGSGIMTFNSGLPSTTPTTPTTPSTERVIYVAPQTVRCYGGTQQDCLQIRERTTDPWAVFYGTIEGFTYRPGYTYQLRVSETRISNPPTGTPPTRLTLVQIISQTPVDSTPDTPTTPTTQTGVLTATTPDALINIRSQPSTQAGIVDYGEVGDRVTVLRSSRATDGYTWYNIRTTTNVEGWVREDLITVSGTTSPPGNGTDNSLQTLPAVNNIDVSQVQYVRSETTANPALERAILRELPGYEYSASEPVSQAVRYFYNQVDLNGDNSREIIVYLVGSFTCGTGGCTALIFQPSGSDYRLVSELTGVSNPIVVSEQRTNGWNDLILYVSGGGSQGAYRVLRYTGRRYPDNPSVEPTVQANSRIIGRALISDRISATTGSNSLLESD
jgi:heat shock protein HslJ